MKRKTMPLLALLIMLLFVYGAYDSYFSLPFAPKAGTIGDEGANPSPRFEKFTVLILGLDGRAGVKIGRASWRGTVYI